MKEPFTISILAERVAEDLLRRLGSEHRDTPIVRQLAQCWLADHVQRELKWQLTGCNADRFMSLVLSQRVDDKKFCQLLEDWSSLMVESHMKRESEDQLCPANQSSSASIAVTVAAESR